MSSGARAEQLAAEFLKKNVLSLLHQTYRCRFEALLLHSADGTQIEWLKNAFSA